MTQRDNCVNQEASEERKEQGGKVRVLRERSPVRESSKSG